MNSTRLTRNDWYFVVICLAILVGGIFFSCGYFHRAFPEASIDFKYDRDNSQPVAEKYLHEQGFTPPADYMHGSAFTYEGYAKTYLEKELGNDAAQKYYGNPVLMWFWFHRWFKPGEKEEYRINVTVDGKLAEFSHLLPEEAVGPNLEQDSAKKLAENFLYASYKLDSNHVHYYSVEKVGRPKRTDWTFTYRDTTIQPVKGSDYRYFVTVQGARVDRFYQYLFVPEAWGASFRKMRSYNHAAGDVDSIFFILTALAIGIVFFIRVRKKDIHWRTALWFGGIGTVLFLMNQLNEFTSGFVNYMTTDPWSGYLLKEFGTMIGVSAVVGFSIMLLTASAEAMYRERYPDKISMPRMFTIRGLRTKSAFKNILLGLTMCSFFFAYQIAFYLIANHFGAWSPVDVPYDDLLKTSFPWIAVLLMGFFPAVSEEFMSRAFSIPFLQKLFRGKVTWLAVIIAAFIWGFGHATYPNEPWFIRGLEVGIAGVIVGILMLRFGILATLVWHYSVDALYTSFLFFRSSNMYLIVTGAIAAGLLCIPLLLAFIAYLRKGSFEPETGMSNADSVPVGRIGESTEEKVEIESAAEISVSTGKAVEKPGSKVLVGGVVLAVLLFTAGIILMLVPVTKFGEDDSFPITNQQAIKTVADSLRSCGWANPDTLTFYVQLNPVSLSGKGSFESYLMKRVRSVKEANEVIKERVGEKTINVRAFKPESRTKYFAKVGATSGKIKNLSIILPEEAPGDSLSKDSARTRIERILVSRGIDLSKWDLKDYYQEVKPKRVDQFFTYEAKEGDPRHVGDAKYRLSAFVVGHFINVSGSYWYKVPEKFEREQDSMTFGRGLYKGLIILAIAVVAILMLWRLLQFTRKGIIPWKRIMVWSILPGIVFVLGSLNIYPVLYDTYIVNPEVPWSIFKITILVGIIVGSIGQWIFVVLSFGLLSGLYPDLGNRIKEAKHENLLTTVLVAAAAAIGLSLIKHTLPDFWFGNHPRFIPVGFDSTASSLYVPYPFFEILSTLVKDLVRLVVLIAFIHYIWSATGKSIWKRVLFFVVAILVSMPLEPLYRNEMLFGMINAIIFVGLVWVLLKKITIGNPIALMTVTVFGVLLSKLSSNLSTGNPDILIPTILAGALVLAGFINWVFGRDRKTI